MIALSTATAAADELPRVALVVACPSGTDPEHAPAAVARETEAKKLLALELGAAVVGASADVTVVRVSCAPPLATLMTIRVDDPITRKSSSRDIDVAGYPESARARVLALAVAELVSASWSEVVTNPAPKVPPAGPEPAIREREAVRSRALPLYEPALTSPRTLVVGVVVRSVVGQVGQIGGALRFTNDVVQSGRFAMGVSFDVASTQGRTDTTLGRVTATAFDVGASLYGDIRFGERVQLRAGPGVRVGSATLEGRPTNTVPTDAGTISGVFTAPHGSLALRILTASAFLFELGAEAGGIVGGPTGRVIGAGTVDEISFDGGYVALSAAVGARFR